MCIVKSTEILGKVKGRGLGKSHQPNNAPVLMDVLSLQHTTRTSGDEKLSRCGRHHQYGSSKIMRHCSIIESVYSINLLDIFCRCLLRKAARWLLPGNAPANELACAIITFPLLYNYLVLDPKSLRVMGQWDSSALTSSRSYSIDLYPPIRLVKWQALSGLHH